jgi:drug/metabolite transporter (DMT)-like permease
MGVLCISFSGILVRLAMASPSTVAFFRTAYALPVLWLIWRLTRRMDQRAARLRRMAVGAGVLLAVDLVLWHQAIGYIGAGLATVLANTQVVFVGLFSWAFQRERPTREAFLVIPIVFLGVALISGLGRPDAFGEDPAAGVVFGVLAGLAYAGFLIGYRRSGRAQSGPPTGPLLDSTFGAAVASLMLGALEPGFSLSLSWPSHGWLLALALTTQVAGWLLIGIALPRLPALDTSVMLLLQPMGTVIWAGFIFGEVLSGVQGLGMALVLAGIVVLSWRGSSRAAALAA